MITNFLVSLVINSGLIMSDINTSRQWQTMYHGTELNPIVQPYAAAGRWNELTVIALVANLYGATLCYNVSPELGYLFNLSVGLAELSLPYMFADLRGKINFKVYCNLLIITF